MQQAAITAVEDLDGFNWGYDPWHYTVPEGSYSTDPEGTRRIVEFRDMVDRSQSTTVTLSYSSPKARTTSLTSDHCGRYSVTVNSNVGRGTSVSRISRSSSS